VSFTNVTAVFSMLHEPPAQGSRDNSATRLFRAEPVLHWTLKRTARAARVGSIASGKQADLVVIDGDPSARIEDIRKVSLVFKEGVGYDPAKLIASVRGKVGLF